MAEQADASHGDTPSAEKDCADRPSEEAAGAAAAVTATLSEGAGASATGRRRFPPNSFRPSMVRGERMQLQLQVAVRQWQVGRRVRASWQVCSCCPARPGLPFASRPVPAAVPRSYLRGQCCAAASRQAVVFSARYSPIHEPCCSAWPSSRPRQLRPRGVSCERCRRIRPAHSVRPSRRPTRRSRGPQPSTGGPEGTASLRKSTGRSTSRPRSRAVLS